MAASNLPHQGQTQAIAGVVLTIAAPIERREQLIELGGSRAWAVIPNPDQGEPSFPLHAHFCRRNAMTPGILEQISQEPAQQARISLHLEVYAFEMNFVVASAFLRG